MEAPHTQALPEEAMEEHPESSDGWKQSTANMKKEKTNHTFLVDSSFLPEVAMIVLKYVHLDKHLVCMIRQAFTNGSLGKL